MARFFILMVTTDLAFLMEANSRKQSAIAALDGSLIDKTNLALAITGLVISAIALHYSRIDFRISLNTRRTEIEKLLDEAWDLLGGKVGSRGITNMSRDSTILEQVRRLIENQALPSDESYAKTYNVLGVYLVACKELDHAIMAYHKALLLSPGNRAVRNNLAAVYFEQGKVSRAEKILREMVEERPDFGAAMYNYAGVLLGQQKTELAAHFFRQAINYGSNHGYAFRQLSFALRQLGREEEAQFNLQRSLELGA